MSYIYCPVNQLQFAKFATPPSSPTACVQREYFLSRTCPIQKKYIRIQWEYSVDDSLTINWPSIDPWLNFSHANEGAVNSFAYSRNQLTVVECSSILCAVDHCWILLYFPCGWPLLNAPIFSLRLTTVERSYYFCAVDHCWILLYFLCSWPLLNAHIFSVRLTTVERSSLFV